MGVGRQRGARIWQAKPMWTEPTEDRSALWERIAAHDVATDSPIRASNDELAAVAGIASFGRSPCEVHPTTQHLFADT